MQNVVTLDMGTPSVQYLCKKDKRLAKVIEMWDLFNMFRMMKTHTPF